MAELLPVEEVLLMEDRAQVHRAGRVAVTGAITRVEVPGIAPVAVDRSLAVQVDGATLLDATLVRRHRALPSGGLTEDASELRKRVEALRLALEEADDVLSRANAQHEVLKAARGDLLRAIAEGAGSGTSDIDGWTRQLAALAERETAEDIAQLDAQRARDVAAQRFDEAHAVLTRAETAEQRQECALMLTLEGDGDATVRASYLVPCAAWRPAFRATLERESVHLECDAVVWQRTGEDWSRARLRFSTARPTLGLSPPRLSEDALYTRPASSRERHTVEVAVRETEIQSAGEAGGSTELPGVDDGGEVRVLEAEGRFSIAGDGQAHRVPLFGFEAPATVERVCPTELSRAVTLLARFPNASGKVLLAGPVDLIREAGNVGRTTLDFAAPGEVVKLSFGSEDGLSVVREVNESTTEAMLTGRRTTTTTVRLHVSNARTAPARLVLEERVPVSEVKEVEVQVLTKDCAPPPATVTREGVARIELELPPHGTRTAVFAWTLSAAAKVAGV